VTKDSHFSSLFKNERFTKYIAIAFTAIAYFLLGKLSFLLANEHNIVTVVIFASEGVALASILYFGRSMAIGIFLGQFILALSGGMDLVSSTAISVTNTLEALLGLYLFDKYEFDRRLSRLKDVIGLALIIIFVLQVFSSIVGSSILLFNSIINYNEYYSSIFSWWFGNTLGQLLLTPFLLHLAYTYRSINITNYLTHATIYTIFILFLEIGLKVENLALLLTLTMPVVIYIVIKKGLNYSLLLVNIMAITSAYSAYINVGIFSISSELDNIININFFILLMLSTALTLGILAKEREAFEKNLRIRIAKEIIKNEEKQLLLYQQTRLAQMGEMISMIAHQWRQPLSAISATAGAIQIKAQKDKLTKETALKHTAKINELSLHLSATIDDFRSFFLVDKELKDSSYNKIVAACLSIIETSTKDKNIKIIQELKSTEKFKTYPNEIKQVVLNLIKNAEDVLVEKEIKEPYIKIVSYQRGDSEVLEVSDNAGGVPPEILNKIFDPYFSTKQEKNGTGLGLYMSKTIIEEHCKGELSVHNTDEGALFRVVLHKGGGVGRDLKSTHSNQDITDE